MRIDKCEPFEVLIANGVKLSITRVNVEHATAYFEVTTNGDYHGQVYQVTGTDGKASWKSPDDIHPLFVKQIGKAIENIE
jgi:hypothetical protein